MNVESVNKGGEVKVIVDEKPFRVARTPGGLFVSQWTYNHRYLCFIDVSPRVDDNLVNESFWWRTILLTPAGSDSYGRRAFDPAGSFTFFDSLSEAILFACRAVRTAEVEELERARAAKKAHREAYRRNET
jgi:hypothetical protein